jgi:phenylacetate-coenzyme A ligase PaaK-like adenylate-forming protein
MFTVAWQQVWRVHASSGTTDLRRLLSGTVASPTRPA